MKLQNTTIATINQMIVAVDTLINMTPDDLSVRDLTKVVRYRDDAVVAAQALTTLSDVTLEDINRVITKCNKAAQITTQQYGSSTNLTVGSLGSFIVADYASIVMMLRIELNRPDMISSKNLQHYDS